MHKLANFSSNPSKLLFEVLVYMLSCIRDNNTFGLKYFDDMTDALVSDILRQASIKTDNQLMAFSYSSWQDCLNTGRSTGEYMIFYQGGQIDHVTHVPGPIDQ